MKSAHLLRQLGKLDEALETLDEAIKKFPQFDKLYMIKGQILEDRDNIPGARQAYAAGTKACPKSITLWILASRLEEKAGIIIKSRALLEKARMQNPKNDILWRESIKVEERAANASGSGNTQAKTMLARAQQDCPTSGILWDMAIWMESGSGRKGKSLDAIRKSSEHPVVQCAIARLFWQERKIEKARQWFGRAESADKDNGDMWAWWLKFERQHGEKVSQNLCVCVLAKTT